MTTWLHKPQVRHSFQRLLLCLVLIVVAGTMTVAVAQPTTDEAMSAEDLSKLRGHAMVLACRQAGFDPAQLACQTCALLPSVHQATCLQCCESYKDTKQLREPYQAAVLVVPAAASEASLDSELETFLREDWDELRQAVGATRLQQVTRQQDDPNNNVMAGRSFWLARTPASLHFLDAALPKTSGSNKALSETQVKELAKETISLYGWKREDIKDMIQTLLAEQ